MSSTVGSTSPRTPIHPKTAALTDGPNDGDPALAADGSLVAFVHQANIYLTATDHHDRTCFGVGVSVQGGLRWAPAATNPSS